MSRRHLDSRRDAGTAAAAITYDVILMDCQMPEMDGCDVTRAIRTSERSNDKHVPYVALTANAMKGEMEAGLEAGMDAYLTKPIQMRDLRQAFARATSTQGSASANNERSFSTSERARTSGRVAARVASHAQSEPTTS